MNDPQAPAALSGQGLCRRPFHLLHSFALSFLRKRTSTSPTNSLLTHKEILPERGPGFFRGSAPLMADIAFIVRPRHSTQGGLLLAKKKLAKEPDDLIGNALAGETDRGVVLVGTAFIDYWLEGLYRRTFTLGAGQYEG